MKKIIFKPSKIKEKKYLSLINKRLNHLFKLSREKLLRKKFKVIDSSLDEVERLAQNILTQIYDPVEVQNEIEEYFISLFSQVDKNMMRQTHTPLFSSSTELLDLIVSNNVQLVTSLYTENIKKLRGLVTHSIIEGTPVQNIQEEIRKMQDISNNRAQTIARTETAKATSQLNRKRFKEIGVTRARWSTAHDDRVRLCHKDRDGKEYDIKKGCYSNCDKRFLQTGEDFSCRCGMLIVLK